MNIKQAKEQLKQTVQAYLSRDEYGDWKIPVIAQRPVLLMGPPGIGKTAIAHHYPPHPPKCYWSAQYSDRKL
jgi:MoxR-like ATPase